MPAPLREPAELDSPTTGSAPVPVGDVTLMLTDAQAGELHQHLHRVLGEPTPRCVRRPECDPAR